MVLYLKLRTGSKCGLFNTFVSYLLLSTFTLNNKILTFAPFILHLCLYQDSEDS